MNVARFQRLLGGNLEHEEHTPREGASLEAELLNSTGKTFHYLIDRARVPPPLGPLSLVVSAEQLASIVRS
jgi:hypothetical protein